MDDFNIDVKSKSLRYDKLVIDLGYHKFDKIRNLFKKKNHKFLIDSFLINTALYFQKTHVSEAV